MLTEYIAQKTFEANIDFLDDETPTLSEFITGRGVIRDSLLEEFAEAIDQFNTIAFADKILPAAQERLHALIVQHQQNTK